MIRSRERSWFDMLTTRIAGFPTRESGLESPPS